MYSDQPSSIFTPEWGKFTIHAGICKYGLWVIMDGCGLCGWKLCNLFISELKSFVLIASGEVCSQANWLQVVKCVLRQTDCKWWSVFSGKLIASGEVCSQANWSGEVCSQANWLQVVKCVLRQTDCKWWSVFSGKLIASGEVCSQANWLQVVKCVLRQTDCKWWSVFSGKLIASGEVCSQANWPVKYYRSHQLMR